MSILPEELQSFDYYRNLTPMYLKDIHGFFEQIKIWYNFSMKKSGVITCGLDVPCGVNTSTKTQSIVSIIDETFKFLDIFNTTSQHLDESSDILNKLGAFFGVSRNFSVTIDSEKKSLSLSDDEFLILVKCQVIKNFFEGTQEHLIKCFNLVNLPVMPLTDANHTAHCMMYMLLQDENEVSQNVKDMFLAGMLSVESLGIYYTYAIQIARNIAIFDSFVATSMFDSGQFII